MATMSTPCRFDDNDYKNWLKCSIALIHFKEGLHDYIDKEVNNLHADNRNTISANLVGTSVQNQCYTCTWQDIKRNKGTWTINCQSRICDRWLSEILAKHINPQNRNINWKNADITRWPADPYEVAKVYMPKGQDRTKNLPQDFDAPAVLSLLKYCVWFSQMIPNCNIVTDLIDFRNEVMHSGDLRVTDFKKDNMIQLLSDLNIHGDVRIELQKIKREDIDINFRETEVRALHGLLHQLTDDLNTVQTTLSSVQDAQVQERQDIEEVKGNTMETGEKLVTTETNFQVLKAQVEQLTEQYQNIKSFLANNPDIDDKNISDDIHAIEKNVMALESKCEKKHQELETKITSMERGTERKFAEIEEKIKTKQSIVLEESDMNSLCNELLHRYKSFRNLPFSVNDKDEEVPLESLYTEVVIKSEDKHKAYDNRSSHKEGSIGNEKEQGTRVTSYKNIFNSGKRTILTGLSGSGKSTFCRKIVNAWCKLKENRKIETSKDVETSLTHKSLNVAGYSPHHISNVIEASTHDSSEVTGPSTHDSSDVIGDENVLLKFDLLFYINSPAISNETKLINVLCNQCIKREQKRDRDKIQETISKLLHAQPEKILIIFDGLDEMGHTPKFLVDVFRRDLYPEISVLMGMRPSRISKLDLKPLSHYDLLIHIQGFSTDNALKFVQKVIDMNNSMCGETKKKFLTKKDREILISFKHIPLLLLFLAQSWYREQSLPHKYKDLQSQIIAFLIRRWIKKAGNKSTVNMSEESMDLPSYPETHFIACKVAYLFLLEGGSGQSDKIPQKKLVRVLGENSEGKLNTLLDCGIISKVDVSQPEMNVSVTFLHMSIQEYLVSIYLVRNEDTFKKFLRSIKTVNDIFRYENLFLFISGLNAMKGHIAFTRICKVCDEDTQVIQYRQGGDNYEVIQKLNAVYRKCVNEMKKQKIIEMPDIYITSDTDYKLLMSTLKSNLAKSLYLGQMRCDELDLNALTSLISLRLERVIKDEECSIHLCSSINSFATLNVLYLYHIKLDDGVLDLRNLTNLRNLKLYDVTMSEECSRCLCRSIGSCTCLEMLFLDIINLHDGELDLSPLTSLISLTLKNITMSWECNKYLYRSISSCAQLKKLHLCQFILCDVMLDPRSFTNLISLTLEDIIMSDEYSRSLSSSISRSTQLENLHLKNITLHGRLLDRRHLTNLTIQRLQEITISNESCGMWYGSINILGHLQVLNLSDLTLQDDVIDLRSSTNLLSLTLKNITMSEACSKSQCSIINSCTCLKILLLDSITLHYGVLDLRSMTSLAHLTLLNVTMSVECGASLCSSISDSTSLSDLHLNDITLHDGLLDLTSPMNLTNLTLDDVIMSEESRRSLCSSISGYAHLEKLHLKNIKLHDSILHLRSETNMISIRLDTVTMSEECSRSLCSSLSRCTDLIKMELMNISLYDGVLDLSYLTSLTSLTLENVTMLDMCIMSLCSSIRGCFCLEHLYLENIKLHNGVLDLGSLTEMNSLRLNNVTMCEECSISLCSSISGFDHLEKLHLTSIKLHDGVLDLRSLTSSMKSLRIENVTMSEECCRSLCSSISRFTHLKELYQEDINLHYGILDLRSQTSLYDLTLLHLTTSDECSRYLCHSICGYAQLEKLNLKGMKLHDGVLDLSSLTNLTEITLDQVIMSEKCYRSLCSSIRRCTNLTKMKFISLHNGALDLSSLSNLTDLTLDNVTMLEECIISLCNSVSCCACLEKLYLHNIILDEKLDLSSIFNLTDLTLNNVIMYEDNTMSLYSVIHGCTCLKHLCLDNLHLNDGVLEGKYLTTMNSLRLCNVTMSKKYSRSLCGSISIFTHLRSIELMCISLYDGVLCLNSLTNMTHLTLDDVIMSEECSRSLCSSLSRCTDLIKMELKNISLHDGVLDLSSLTSLTSLTLENVTMLDMCIMSLCSSIRGCFCLEHLYLENIKLHNGLLDLGSLTKINSLRLNNVTMCEECSKSLCSSISGFDHLEKFHLKSIKLHDGVLDLRSLNNMISFRLDGVTMSKECCRSLCFSISSFTYLQELYLGDITLNYGVPNPRSLTNRNYLTLLDVTMSEECSRSLCSVISGYAHLEKLHLKNINLHDGVLNLRSLTNMSSLRIHGVTMSEECCRYLCSSFSTFTHLEELYLDSITLHFDVSDLRALTNLKDLTLLHVNMSEECSRSLCSIVNGDAQMEELHLKHIRLHDGVLDLRSLTNMSSLRIDNLIMSEECCRSLCSSINSFTHLEELYLKSITIYYGEPDLRSLPNLKNLALLHVILSEELSRSLCSIINDYVHLEMLHLKHIKLHDGVLDLRFFTNMNSLILDKVTMSDECSMSLCICISSFTQLEELYLEDIKLHYGILDLRSLTNLANLTLIRVTMSRECSGSLCHSICGYAQLEKLNLKGIKLHDGVLDLSSLTNLTEITLDQVIMSEKCYRSLCSSIRRCTNLTKMKFISLHNGALDLSSLSNLTDLTLDNVTVLETRSMQSSINSCTSLVKLYLHNIELHDSILDLSSISNLTDLTLDNVDMQEECSIYLCDYISGCMSLEKLYLRDIILHGILNLSSLFNMTDLVLVNVTMLEECTMTLCHSISGCTCLKSLYLYNMKLNVGVLDLRYLTNMNSLRLHQVTISDTCSRFLCSSISNFAHLKTMELKYISLHDGALDMSSLTSLTDLSLENVTMSEECSTSLYSSISRCTDLKKMKLKNISLHDLTSLTHLTLDDVIMPVECCRSVCSSISGYAHLEKLHLKNIKLHDGILHLRSPTNMTHLTLDDVIMSEECSRSLCSSLSRCTDLIKMKLKNISLRDGVLDLRSLTKLNDLMLENVTMLEECSTTLCRSICFCTCLKNLYLYNIQLHHGIIDLTSLTNLSFITVVQVSMSDKCKIYLENSISNCKNLLELNWNKFKVDDANRSNK